MGPRNPFYFEWFSGEYSSADMFQNFSYVKLRSSALIFNSTFADKYKAYLWLTLSLKNPLKFSKIHFTKTVHENFDRMRFSILTEFSNKNLVHNQNIISTKIVITNFHKQRKENYHFCSTAKFKCWNFSQNPWKQANSEILGLHYLKF